MAKDEEPEWMHWFEELVRAEPEWGFWCEQWVMRIWYGTWVRAKNRARDEADGIIAGYGESYED